LSGANLNCKTGRSESEVFGGDRSSVDRDGLGPGVRRGHRKTLAVTRGDVAEIELRAGQREGAGSWRLIGTATGAYSLTARQANQADQNEHRTDWFAEVVF